MSNHEELGTLRMNAALPLGVHASVMHLQEQLEQASKDVRTVQWVRDVLKKAEEARSQRFLFGTMTAWHIAEAIVDAWTISAANVAPSSPEGVERLDWFGPTRDAISRMASAYVDVDTRAVTLGALLQSAGLPCKIVAAPAHDEKARHAGGFMILGLVVDDGMFLNLSTLGLTRPRP